MVWVIYPEANSAHRAPHTLTCETFTHDHLEDVSHLSVFRFLTS